MSAAPTSSCFQRGVGLALQDEPKRRKRNQLSESETVSIFSDMACTISHDMRHSLSAIYANAEFLERPDMSAHVRAEIVREIQVPLECLSIGAWQTAQVAGGLHGDGETVCLQKIAHALAAPNQHCGFELGRDQNQDLVIFPGPRSLFGSMLKRMALSFCTSANSSSRRGIFVPSSGCCLGKRFA